MKKAIKEVLALLAILSVCSLFSCGEKTINVTFVQDGQNTITKTLMIGESLTDVPKPKSIDGYTIAWDRTDFENLTSSITVNAVMTPNVYTIHYNVGKGVVLENEETFATYMQDVILETPSLKGSTFVGWKINGEETYLENGIYTLTEDVIVTAVWSVNNNQEYTYFY